MKYKILIVDDDPAIVKFIAANLEANQYSTLEAKDGGEALIMIERELPDLVILDIMMPVLDGFEVCRKLREWSMVPVIMLSARNDEEDKVRSLNMGADDYLCKPFGLDEMLARIKAVLRRNGVAAGDMPATRVFTSGNLEINYGERRVKIAGEEISLTLTEYNLLQQLALNSPRVLTYQALLHKVWGTEYSDERDYLYVFIRRLRRKIERNPQSPKHIFSIRDVGYRLE